MVDSVQGSGQISARLLHLTDGLSLYSSFFDLRFKLMSKHSYLRAELEGTGLSCYVLEIAGLVSPANFYLVDAPRDRFTFSRGFL